MTVREVAEPVTGPAEARQNLAARVIENVQLLVAPVHDVHEPLLGVARERNPPDRAARIGQRRRARSHPDAPDERAHFVEHLDAIALAVADVDEPGAAHRDAVHQLCEHPAYAIDGFLRRRLAAPLTKE